MVYVFVLMVFTYYTVLINGLKNGETIGEEYLSFHGQIAGLVANFGLTLFLVIDMARGKSKLLNNRIRNIVLSFFSAMVVYVSARILYSPEQFPSYSEFVTSKLAVVMFNCLLAVGQVVFFVTMANIRHQTTNDNTATLIKIV